jgi:hypothetical protein
MGMLERYHYFFYVQQNKVMSRLQVLFFQINGIFRFGSLNLLS